MNMVTNSLLWLCVKYCQSENNDSHCFDYGNYLSPVAPISFPMEHKILSRYPL